MIYFIVSFYLLLYYLASRRNYYFLFFLVPCFTFILLKNTFFEYFSHFNEKKVYFNYWLYFFVTAYFLIEFIIASYAYHKKTLGIIIFCFLLSLISYSGLIPPLNPLILLYPHIDYLLPKSNFSFINIFLIYLFCFFIFTKTPILQKITLLSIFAITFNIDLYTKDKKKSVPKIAIIQVGLYYKNGGTSENFYSDLKNFIHNNNDVDLVVFSENLVYGYKDHHNKRLAENLIFNIEKDKLYDKKAFIFNFYGFYDLNNVVSLFKYKNISILKQKDILIPFIEKEGILNKKHDIKSNYLTVNNKNKNKNIDFLFFDLGLFICYEALFPNEFTNNKTITIVQSDYNQLNKGDNYDNIIKYGSILSKFSNAMNSKLFINVQNLGGTVVIREGWLIDDYIYEQSKNNSFLVIR